ncbi:MAG: hypothetical protein R3F00_07625 [Dokdonella sp.]
MRDESCAGVLFGQLALTNRSGPIDESECVFRLTSVQLEHGQIHQWGNLAFAAIREFCVVQGNGLFVVLPRLIEVPEIVFDQTTVPNTRIRRNESGPVFFFHGKAAS